MGEIAINGRFRRQRMTGIQRVAASITARLKTPHQIIEPDKLCQGAKGHIWEQVVLPIRAKGRTIWDPCNTGPIVYSSQIITIHGAAVFDHPEWFSRNFVRLNHTVWPIIAKKARKLVTVSYFSRDRISEVLSIPKEQIEVVWNGVDESFQPASQAETERATKRIGICGSRYFATLSTLEPRKNLRLVLDAWARIKDKLPSDFVLVVIGGKGKQDVFNHSYSQLPSSLDRVVFSGYVPEDELSGLLSGSHAVLYPSIYEGFGLPVLEAMACGVPAITTHQTSLPEVGGEAALYVDPHDADELAKLMLDLASSEDLRIERSALSLQQARQFSWGTAASRMDEIFAKYAE